MKKLVAILSVYKITALCAAVLLTASLSFASISTARPGVGETTLVKKEKAGCPWYQSRTFYSDASMTTVVGGRVWWCDGSYGGYGRTSLYYTEIYCECEEGI